MHIRIIVVINYKLHDFSSLYQEKPELLSVV